MTNLRKVALLSFVTFAVLAASGSPGAQQAGQTAPTSRSSAASLPSRLTDQEFWALSQTLSEPGGSFVSDNLVSNETGFQKVLPLLVERHPSPDVYLGVGPEQNYTYIAALKPAMVFILDIRRGNRDLHLMYKALFELAPTRADFVSLLFSRPRPDGLTPTSTAAEIFAAFAAVEPSPEAYQNNLARIKAVLTKTHGLPLTDEELAGIEYVYDNFQKFGPAITYSSSRMPPRPVALPRPEVLPRPFGTPLPNLTRVAVTGNYAGLMQATDANDQPRSYLSSEELFSVVKTLHARNLLVPVIGDFAGPKAMRAIGEWIRTRRARVAAFYLSNVEDYLYRGGVWNTFCQNASTLPLEENADFIRSSRPRPITPPVPPPPAAAAPPGSTMPPNITGFMIRYTADPAAAVRVTFSDGTAREMSQAEFEKMMQTSPPPRPGVSINFPGNTLGSIAEETKACR